MMKGYYLFAPVEPSCVGPESGVERKVRSQCKALNEWIDCELVILPAVEYTGSRSEKIIRRLPFTTAWRKWEYKGEFNDADFLYIRQVYHDDSFVKYLKAIKKQNPSIKIIYEVPTYPYDKEKTTSLENISFIMKEKTCREKAAKYMDRIVTFYDQKEIWGVPCIKLINGFNFSSVSLKERKATDPLQFVSVSTTADWHGYDRVIEGMHQYYKNGGKENIEYHIVGNVMPLYQELIEKYDLQKHVILHGRMSGEALGNIYQQCLLAFDILGGHRKDYPISSTLKSREYGAYGLPIVTSSRVDYLPEDYKYQLMLPYDETPVDMEKVLEFYHQTYDQKDCNQVAKEIRDFAEARCDMSIAMQPIVNWLKEERTVNQ